MAILRVRTGKKIELGALDTLSDVYILEGDIATAVFQLIFPSGAGVARIETTLATDEELEDGLDVAADWEDWDLGDVIANTGQEVATAPNAFRIDNSGGTAVYCRYRGNYGD